jgi:hypothetical protein
MRTALASTPGVQTPDETPDWVEKMWRSHDEVVLQGWAEMNAREEQLK